MADEAMGNPDVAELLLDLVEATQAFSIEDSAGKEEEERSILDVQASSSGVLHEEGGEEVEVEGRRSLLDFSNEVISQVFQFLDLESRCRLAQTCSRLQQLLEAPSNGVPDVVVLNLFQQAVWEDKPADTKLRCRPLASARQLHVLLRHLFNCHALKLWFKDAAAVRAILAAAVHAGLRLRCLDLYNYADDMPLEVVEELVPDIPALTLRPHCLNHFCQGYTLRSLPAFQRLETLVLEAVNLGPGVRLPPNLLQLEWTNRNPESLPALQAALLTLQNLEYVSLSHLDLTSTPTFREFFAHLGRVPKLQFLVLRFCRFPEPKDWATLESSAEEPLLPKLKVLKLDLCTGNLSRLAEEFLRLSSPLLKIISLHWIYEELDVEGVRALMPVLHSREISLQVALLQRSANSRPSRETPWEMPESGGMTLWKLDCSFLTDAVLLASLLPSPGPLPLLSELKFVSCPALTDEVLGSAAASCPGLRRVFVSSCDGVKGPGVEAFVSSLTTRRTKHLAITWRSGPHSHPASFYLHLLAHKRANGLAELESRFIGKRFHTNQSADDTMAERILVWEKTGKARTLVVQNYGDTDSAHIYGFAIPPEDDDAGRPSAALHCHPPPDPL